MAKPEMQDYIIGAIIAIFGLQIIALIVGVWVPEFRTIRLGQGVLLLGVLIAAFLAVAILRQKFAGFGIQKTDIIFFLIVVGLVILMIYFLPRMIPDIFAREEFVGTINRMFRVQ